DIRGRFSPLRPRSHTRMFGWIESDISGTLHHALVAAGARSLVTTPMRLSLERRRKNDRLDARELCVRLARHLEGHAHELKPIRIPSVEEQQRRELGRQREFWKRELRRLENH